MKYLSLITTIVLFFNSCKSFNEYTQANNYQELQETFGAYSETKNTSSTKKKKYFQLVSIEDTYPQNPEQNGIYLYSYNEQNLISKIEYKLLDKNQTKLIYKYSFDENRTLKESTIDSNGDGVVDIKYIYSYKNHRINTIKVDFNNDKTIEYLYRYSYNYKGFLESYKIESLENSAMGISNFNSRIFEKNKYLCDSKICIEFLKFPRNAPENFNPLPNVVSKLNTNSSLLASKEIEYSYLYNKSGYLATILVDENKDNTIDKRYNYYHLNGFLVEIALDEDANGIEDYSQKYEYTTMGLIESLKIDYYYDGITDMQYNYKYNDTQQLLEINVDVGANGTINSSYLYNYKDNVIKSLKIDNDNDKIIDRIINYNYKEI